MHSVLLPTPNLRYNRIYEFLYPRTAPDPCKPKYSDVQAMVSHFDFKSEEWKNVILAACKNIETAFKIKIAKLNESRADNEKITPLDATELVR